MRIDQIKRFADASEHPQRQHINLEDAQLINIVLVPFDKTTIRHRPVADRHRLDQRPFGEDKPAHMLAQMTRHPDHLIRQLDRAGHEWITQIDPRLCRFTRANLTAPRAPDRFGQRRGYIFGQAHDLAHFAHRHARTIMDHCGTKGRPMAPVLFIDVLNDLLTPLMFKIDVDIGGLFTFFRDETLKQKVILRGINSRDPQHITHSRVRSRAPALTQNGRHAIVSRKVHDLMNRQEVLRDIKLFDQRQFFAQDRFNIARHTLGIAVGRPLPCQQLQMPLWGKSLWHSFLRVFIGQLFEVEITSICNVPACTDRMGPFRKKAGHLGGRFQMPFSVGI